MGKPGTQPGDGAVPAALPAKARSCSRQRSLFSFFPPFFFNFFSPFEADSLIGLRGCCKGPGSIRGVKLGSEVPHRSPPQPPRFSNPRHGLRWPGDDEDDDDGEQGLGPPGQDDPFAYRGSRCSQGPPQLLGAPSPNQLPVGWIGAEGWWPWGDSGGVTTFLPGRKSREGTGGHGDKGQGS